MQSRLFHTVSRFSQTPIRPDAKLVAHGAACATGAGVEIGGSYEVAVDLGR